MRRSRHVVYFDESGDHGLAKIDPAFPVFVLCGCLFEIQSYLGGDSGAFSAIKFRHFGHDAVVFHSREIRKQLGPFSVLADAQLRANFMQDIARFFLNSSVVLIAAAIDKVGHKARYRFPHDPYAISLRFCLERLYATLRDRDDHDALTVCIFEKRGNAEDGRLAAEFERICRGDNHWGRLPFRLVFASKQTNMPGLQIADLAAYPIARRAMCPARQDPAWTALSPRIRCSPNGEIVGWGLKIFPAEKP